jgi:hypothetical protein
MDARDKPWHDDSEDDAWTSAVALPSTGEVGPRSGSGGGGAIDSEQVTPPFPGPSTSSRPTLPIKRADSAGVPPTSASLGRHPRPLFTGFLGYDRDLSFSFDVSGFHLFQLADALLPKMAHKFFFGDELTAQIAPEKLAVP